MKEVFFESIRVKDGKIHNIDFHNRRLNSTRKAIFGIEKEIDLSDFIKVPDTNFYKCRVEYGKKIETIEFFEYTIIDRKKFKIVKIPDNIDYSFKSTKRKFIDQAFQKRGECDDIIMQRGGFLTDSSVANIACLIGDKWVTPSNPISKGTTRERYLKIGKIIEGKIKYSDVHKIKRFAIMNALFGFLEIKDFEIVS